MVKKIDIFSLCKLWRLSIIYEDKPKWYYRQVKCLCDCWNILTVWLQNLLRWNTKSCWCINIENMKQKRLASKHCLYKHKLYPIRNAMISRCYHKNNIWYKNYWWKGIFVCDRWFNIQLFLDDMLPRYDLKKRKQMGRDKWKRRWYMKRRMAM